MLGSLSKPQNFRPLPDAGPNPSTMCCTHPVWKTWSAATLAALRGSQPAGYGATMWLESFGQGNSCAPGSDLHPLPASGSGVKGSVSVWAPHASTEKLHSVSRLPFVFATEPTMGIVRNGSAPPALVTVM